MHIDQLHKALSRFTLEVFGLGLQEATIQPMVLGGLDPPPLLNRNTYVCIVILSWLLMNKPQASGRSSFRVGLSIPTLRTLPLLQLRVPVACFLIHQCTSRGGTVSRTGPPLSVMRFGNATLESSSLCFPDTWRDSMYTQWELHNGKEQYWVWQWDVSKTQASLCCNSSHSLSVCICFSSLVLPWDRSSVKP